MFAICGMENTVLAQMFVVFHLKLIETFAYDMHLFLPYSDNRHIVSQNDYRFFCKMKNMFPLFLMILRYK